MKTLLVTGGCGFIGSHFVHMLLKQADWRVLNLDKLTYAGGLESLTDIKEGSRYHFVQGDISDATLVNRLFEEERPWVVVNFAAESHVDRSILDPSPFLQTNTIGTHVLLEASRCHRVERFIHISTDEVYGDAEGKKSFHEESPLHPSSPYAASKAAADLLCLAYERTYGVPILIVRSSNNYGPFQFPEKLIPLIIRNALIGEELPVYGDGLQQRDWLYTEDNCRAIFLVLERGEPGSIYNVGTEEEQTNLEVIRSVCRLLAQESRLDDGKLLERLRFVPDRPGHDRRYAMSTEKVRRELGWAPTVPFETGLRETVRWYIEHRDRLVRVASKDYQAYYEAVYNRAWNRS